MQHYSPTLTLHRAATLGEMPSGSKPLIFSGSIFRTCSLCLPVRAVQSKLPGIGFPVGSRFCHIWKLTPQDRMARSSCRRLLASSPRCSRLAWSLLSAYRMRFLSSTPPHVASGEAHPPRCSVSDEFTIGNQCT